MRSSVSFRFRRTDKSVLVRQDAAVGGGPEWTMDCGLRLLLSTVLCLSQSLLVCCSCKSFQRRQEGFFFFLKGIKELKGLILVLTRQSPSAQG